MKDLLDSLIKFLRHSKRTMLLILVVTALTVVVVTSISIWLSRIDNYLIPSLGTIYTTGVKAYGGNITLNARGEQQIDWGTIYSGSLTIRSFYIKSESNIKTTLTLMTSNWTFFNSEGEDVTASLAEYNLTREESMDLLPWTYTGVLISPGEEIYVTITLWASNNIRFTNYLINEEVKEFGFDIHIRTSGD